MLTMFKGELTLDDIMSMPKKMLNNLKEARLERLEAEEKYADELRRNNERESIQKQILS